MHRALAWTGKSIAVAAIAAGPLVAHLAPPTAPWPAVGAVLSAAQLGVLVFILLSGSRLRWWLAVIAPALLLLVFADGSAGHGNQLFPGIIHAVGYAGLLAIFGASLRPSHEALLSGVVRRLHGPLAPDVAAYTRGATVAWCWFFAAQLAGSLALFLFAPRVDWWFFVSVLNFPLVMLMFAGEYACRMTHLRNRPRSKLRDVLRAFSQRDLVAAKHAKPGCPSS